MSKKDYIAVAKAIIKAHNNYNAYKDHDRAIDGLIDTLCQVFRADNHNFNEARFYAYIEEGINNA